jgi:hypothetical protein
MSTHCWVMQQWMQPASKRQLGKQISTHAWWCHTAVVGECHMLTWLLRDMPQWCHTAPGVGECHVTSTFPQVTSHILQLRPLPRNVTINNLPRNNMGRCVFSVVRAEGLSWRQMEWLEQLAVSGQQFSKFLSECQMLRKDNSGTRSAEEYKRSACEDVLCEVEDCER